MSRSRQLAAIMFTDIVGYTKLMGEDEEKAFELLKKNRLIQRPIIERFNGRWLKEIGDGVLASFNAVSDAVYCAGAIQKACENEPDLKLRIGIHEGEVVFEENDVFGDGVNIASRLEALASVGGILVSDAVHKNLLNKKGIQSKFAGEKRLKNVREPVRTYKVTTDNPKAPIHDYNSTITAQDARSSEALKKYTVFAIGIILLLAISFIFFNKEKLATKSAAVKFIAVLPFENLSGDKEFEYFADGMSQELCNRLSNMHNLKVIARRAGLRFKGGNLSPQEIAKELGVAYLVEGNVRKSGNDVRVNSQLIEGSTGVQLASYYFSGRLEEVLDAQDQAAFGIANELQLDLNPVEVAAIKNRHTNNHLAYDAYLRGWMIFESTHADLFPSKGKLDLAKQYFSTSVKEDSSFALAYAGLSLVESFYIFLGVDTDYDIAEKAFNMANKALSMEPDLSEGYLALAELALVTQNYHQAIDDFKKSLDLNPENPIGWCHLAFSCLNSGDFSTAEYSARMAVKQQPTYIWSHFQLGNALRYLERYREAINAYEHCTQLNSSWHLPYLFIGEIQLDQQQYALASEAFGMAEEISEDPGINIGLGETFAELNEQKRALDELEKAFQKGYTDFQYILTNPHFEKLENRGLKRLISQYDGHR